MNPSRLPLRFTARVISGSGRGRTLGVPTLNLDLRDVPPELQDGVYACRAFLPLPPGEGAPHHSAEGCGAGEGHAASMHKGSRPTFGDTPSCEVHIIDQMIAEPPEAFDVEVVRFLRGITKFPSAEALSKQMLEDNRNARDILSA